MGTLSKWRDVWKRFSGRGTYPHQLAFLLLIPLRGLRLSPRTLVARLHLSETSHVLELGPGPGYFSVEVARSTPRGQLCLVDLQLEMVRKARRRIACARLENVRFVQAGGSALPFGAGVFDVAFLVAVLGEVPDPGSCLDAIGHCLCPGGLLSITEVTGDPDAMSQAEVSALASARQFRHVETLPVRSGGFTINFRKPDLG